MEKKPMMDPIPCLHDFITIRQERFGSIVFNPYMGLEEELDPIGTFIALMCNGHNRISQIEKAVKNGFNGNHDGVKEVLKKLSDMYALTSKKGEGALRPLLPDIEFFHDEEPYLSAPKNVIWDVTYRCNLKCPHCLTDSSKALKNELTTKQAFDLIDTLAESKVLYLSLSGGEPFLRPDILSLIKRISATNMRMDMATNGVALPKKILKGIRDLSVFQVQVSIDGIEETHDQFRGKKGAFKAAVRNIQVLKEEDIVVSLSTTVTSKNIRQIDRIIDFAVEMGCSGFKAIPFIPAGRGINHADLRLNAQDYLNLSKRLSQRRKELEDTLNIVSETTFEFLLDPPPKQTVKNGQVGCSAGHDTLSIGADGTVFPCPFFQNLPIGNVLENSLERIWMTSPVLNRLRTIEKKEMKEPCKSCAYCLSKCRGGCRAAAYLAHQDLTGPDPTCYLYAKTLSGV